MRPYRFPFSGATLLRIGRPRDQIRSIEFGTRYADLGKSKFRRQDPPAALFRYSRNRSGVHPVEHLHGFMGILQADAYAGYNPLYAPGRVPGPVTESLCWSHGRRKFYELADIAAGKRRGQGAAPISPLALEAVKRIAPLVAELKTWMRTERTRLSRHAPVAKAMAYMLASSEGLYPELR